MRLSYPRIRIWLLALAGLGLAVASPARAAGDEPDRGRPADAPAESAEAIQAPVIDFQPDGGLPYGPLQLLTLESMDPMDRGSDYTDAGLGHPAAEPNALELAKLEMARAAIEASRAAGTLYSSMGPRPADPGDLEALRAAKMDRLRTQQPASTPAVAGPSGIGGGLEPIQMIGPAEPTAEELAKLEGTYPASVEPAAKTEPAAPAADADPAQTPDAEVQR